jgi:hypothetical protein
MAEHGVDPQQYIDDYVFVYGESPWLEGANP